MKESDLEYFKQLKEIKETPKLVSNKVWSYTRVSTKEQLDRSSLDHQSSEIEKYINNHKFNITEKFGNTYESASSDFDRKEFSRMYDKAHAIQEKPFAIIIYKLNRLSRTGESGISIFDTLVNKLKIHIISVRENLRSDDPNDRIRMLDSLLEAKKENYNKSQSTEPGMKSWLLSGNILGRCPRGYDHYGPRVKDYSKIREKQFLEINDEGRLLQKAWYWKVDGMSDIGILKKLHLRGLVISKQALSSMWRNPFYCGILIHKMLDNPVKGNWEALISQEIFKRVGKIINSNNQGYKQDRKNEKFPLGEIMYCEKCKTKMTYYTVKKKAIDYYKCNRCKGMNVNANKVHKLFENSLAEFQLKPQLIQAFKKQLKKTFEINNQDSYDNAKMLKAKLKIIRNAKELLKERFAYGKIDQDLYEQFITKEQQKEDDILSELENTNIEISNLSEFIKKAINISTNLPVYWRRYNLEIKRKIQNLVFPNNIYLSISKDKYLTNEISPIFNLINLIPSHYIDIKKGLLTVKVEKSLVVAGTGLEPATFGL